MQTNVHMLDPELEGQRNKMPPYRFKLDNTAWKSDSDRRTTLQMKPHPWLNHFLTLTIQNSSNTNKKMGLGGNKCSKKGNARYNGNDNITVLPNNSITIKCILPLFGLPNLLPKGLIRILENKAKMFIVIPLILLHQKRYQLHMFCDINFIFCLLY